MLVPLPPPLTQPPCLKLMHSFSANNSSFHFYFNRLPRLWNCLPPVDLNGSLSSAISQIKRFFWLHFTSNFNSSEPCSYHLPQMYDSILQVKLCLLVLLHAIKPFNGCHDSVCDRPPLLRFLLVSLYHSLCVCALESQYNNNHRPINLCATDRAASSAVT